ncbi:MAG: response regulator [Chloroflexi bacterium]|nr:response regulator [Chloroflexota bacterium]
MKNTNRSSKDPLDDLHRRAEAVARSQWVDPGDLSPADIRQLVHDLQVHQIELEAQNEELHRTQLELEASRDRYADLYDFAPVGYFTVGEKGLIVEANLTGAAMLGVTREDLLKRPLSHFIVREDQNSFYLYHRRLFDTQTLQACEIRLMKKDASQFYARLEGIVAQDMERAAPVCRAVIRDITERKQAEAALRESNRRLEQALTGLKEAQEKTVQQERLAVVGQLAAGIAHDFNNILTGMLGFAQLLQMSPQMPEAAQADLGHIVTSGQRAAHLIRQLLDFSRKSIRWPQQLDLVPFIKEAVKFLERTIPENIRINLKIAPGVYLVEADPAQIQQLLTNLAINSRDAMPAGGILQIFVARIELEGEIRCVGCNQAVEGEWIRMTVTDNGRGIPPEALPRIFEPFFTTKEVGEGSGLGLAQVLGIVEQQGGHLTVNSREWRGTTFNIYLPPLTPSQDKVEAVEIAPGLPGQGETILLVEDEPMVLEVGRRILASLGYQALTARSGREALTVYAEHRDEIALVLLDMVMPDMDGVDLFNLLKAQTPEIKVVMMSGYPLGEKGARLLEQGVVDWFQKPMSYPDLAQIISQALLSDYNERING